jgi:CRISPR/Cas system-associated exonuclease Cas4 (RecB family)
MPSGRSPSISASDLADYAFCPRSHWYHHHPPSEGPTADGVRRAEAGTERHVRQLRGERHRAERGPFYWVLVLVGLLVAVGGILWWL